MIDPSHRRHRHPASALTALAIGLVLCVSGCDRRTPADNQQAIANAIDADLAITDDADGRADRLDEKSDALRAIADRRDAVDKAGLRNEAAADAAAAASIRRHGQMVGDQAEDAAEGDAGLLNRR